MIVFDSTRNKEINFRKELKNNKSKYKIDGKTTKFSHFVKHLIKLSVKISPLTIVPQGTVAEKIRSLNPVEMRSYLELLTQASKEVDQFRKKDDQFELIKQRIKESKTLLTERELKLKILKREYDDIQKFKELMDEREVLNNEIALLKVQEFKSKIIMVEKEQSHLKKLINRIDRKISSLETKLNLIKKYNSKVETEREELINQRDDLIGKKSVINFQINEINKILDELRNNTEKLEEIFEDLEKKCIETKEILNKVIEKDEEYSTIYSDLESEKEKLQNDSTALEKSISDQNQEIVLKNQEFKDISTDNKEQIRIELDNSIKLLKGEVDNLFEKSAQLRNAIEEKEKKIKDLRVTIRDQKLPSYIESFKDDLDLKNVKYIGPICSLIRLKEGIEPRIKEKLIDIIARLGGSRLFGFLFFDDESVQIAEMISKNKRKKIRFYLRSGVTKINLKPKHKESLGYLIKFLDYPEEIENLIYYLFRNTQIVENSKIGRSMVAEIQGSVVSLDYYRINHGCGIKEQEGLRKFDEIIPYIGVIDVSYLKDQLNTIEDENKKYKNRFDDIRKIRDEKSKTLRELEKKREKFDELEKWLMEKEGILKEISINEETFRKIADQIDEIDNTIEKVKSNKIAIKTLEEDILKLEKSVKILKKEEEKKEELEKLLKEKEEIEKLINNDEKTKNISEKLKRIEIIREILSKNQEMMENLKKKHTQNLQITTNNFSTYSKELSIWKSKIPKDCKRKYDKTHNELQVKLKATQELIDSYQYLDLSKEKLYLKRKKELETLTREIEKLEIYRERLEREREAIKKRWSKLFLEKITHIEKKANSYLKDNGIKISLNLKPVDIIEGKVYLTTLVGDKTIKANGLSGGQASMLTIAMLIAGQQLSNSIFFVLDEFDMSLDPPNTEYMIELLQRNSKFSQYILLTPAKNRALLEVAQKLIGISAKDNKVEIWEEERINEFIERIKMEV